MASLQHLGGDRWRVREYVGPHPLTGRPRQASRVFTANGERAARRKMHSIVAQLQATANAEYAERAKTAGSIGQLVDDWMAVKERTLSPSTLIAYQRHARAIKRRFGHIKATELTGRMIDDWYADIAAKPGATAKTVEVAHRHLRAVLRFGYKRGDVPMPATDQATPGAAVEFQIEPPTASAVAAVLTRLPVEQPWARAASLAATLGCRRGEILGLRWDDWHGDEFTIRHSITELKGGGVHVGPPKGKRIRDVPVLPPAAAVLIQQRLWLEGTGIESPWVFPDLAADPSGLTPRRPDWLSKTWIAKRDSLGASGWRLHDLRHAYATTLLDNGTPINVVQSWLGHAKASTTMDIYGHSDRAGEATGREVLRRALSPPPLELDA